MPGASPKYVSELAEPNIHRSAYANTLGVEESRREEVVLHTYDFYPDA
jgi:hypothetical protein